LTTITLISLAALWMAGGILLAHDMLINPHTGADVAATNKETVAGLLRFEPAALIALTLFLMIWPGSGLSPI